jgi:hypothetical protein
MQDKHPQVLDPLGTSSNHPPFMWGEPTYSRSTVQHDDKSRVAHRKWRLHLPKLWQNRQQTRTDAVRPFQEFSSIRMPKPQIIAGFAKSSLASRACAMRYAVNPN